MVSTKQFLLCNFVAYTYIFYVRSSHTLVSATYSNVYCDPGYGRSENIPHDNYSVDHGLSYQCGHNLRLKKLTKPFILGEDPFWSAYFRSLFFVDAQNGTICRYTVHTEKLFCVKLGNNAVADVIPLRNIAHKYLSTYGNNLTIVTWDATSTKATFRTLKQVDPDSSHFVNDAKADTRGVLFFCTEPQLSAGGLNAIPRNQSQLYNIIKGKQKTLRSKMSFGNGIGFSPDEKFLYESDSIFNCTNVSYYDRTSNSLKDTRVLVDYGSSCRPDSMTVDKQGYIWTACNPNSRIIKLDPQTGRIICSISLPAKAPTNLAFGECPGKPNGKLVCLYVTSSSSGLSSPTQYDGALYLVENSGSEGILPNKVDFSQFDII